MSAGKPRTAAARPTTNLDAALRYAEAGYPVLLVHSLQDGVCTCHKGKMCNTSGKHPTSGKGWQKKATTDAEIIKQWFSQKPDAHVGIMPPKGHAIIDVDPRNGGKETIRALQGKAKAPFTVMQRSGGKGYHLVFKGEPNGPLGDGIDVKKHGRGFVVAWPSGHISGGAYTWEEGKAPWDIEPAELPAWLKGRAAAHDSGFEDLVSPDIYVGAAPTDVPIDTVREALNHIDADEYQMWINIGQALRHSYGDEGQELWLRWSRTSDKYQDGDEAKWESFDQNRDRPLITIRSIMARAKRNGYRPTATEFENSLWVTGRISDYLHGEPPAINWVCEPCIPAGKVAVLAAAGGTGKSFLSVVLAMHMAIGEEFGPFKPTGKPVRTLIIAAEEDKDDIARRVSAICKALAFTPEQLKLIDDNVTVVAARGMDWRMLQYDDARNVQETSRVDYIIEQARECGAQFVVLDPLAKFNGANENDNGEMAHLMAVLDRIAVRTGAAVLVIHHTKKTDNDRETTQASVRGASAIVDNARAAIVLTRMSKAQAPLYNIQPDDAGRFVVCTFAKNNYGPYTKDSFFRIGTGGVPAHAPEITQAHSSSAKAVKDQERKFDAEHFKRLIVDELKANGGELSQRKLSVATGMNRNKIKDFLEDLAEDGYVKQAGLVGTNSRWMLTALGKKATRNDDVSELL